MDPRFARITSLVASVAMAVAILLAFAAPVVACSCIGPQPMAAYAGEPEHEIFTGRVGVPEGLGVPVQVTRWFQGAATPATVWLDGSGFGEDGSSCGTALPPSGTEWIFVAFRSEGGALNVNSCTPHASAADPQGQAMFRDAVATFGDGHVMGTEPGPDPAVPTMGAPAGLPVPVPVVVAIGVGVAGVLLALALYLRRAGRRIDRA